MIGIIIGGTLLAIFLILASLYRVVPANEAHVIIQAGKTTVYTSNPKISENGKSAYFKIPEWFFLFGLGMKIHKIPLDILPVHVTDFLAFDKDRARFVCDIIAYVTAKDPITAAMRFSGNVATLKEQVSKVVQATTRDATTKQTIREIINNRQGVIQEINVPLKDALTEWGLDLNDIELIEFKDPIPGKDDEEEASHVIADISSIIEEEINSEARQKNAEQKKEARLKEALAEETAKIREIEKEEEIGKREEQKLQLIAKEAKKAKEEQLEVTKVEQVKNAQIQKEKQIVIAKQDKEVEAINKAKKRLEGEGTRLQQQEEAKGAAAPIREKGLAEAEAKEKLQAALNKFKPEAIQALIAEKVVEMQEKVGVEGAKALTHADMKVFAGTEGDKAGFDIGKTLAAITVSNEGAAKAILNRLGTPHDIGIKNLALGATPAPPSAPEGKQTTKKRNKKTTKETKPTSA